MSGNKSEFYRGKRKKTGPALIVSIVVLSLIAFVILLFYGLQKYIVVTNSGLYLDLPILSDKQSVQSDDDGSAMREFEQVNAELVIGEPDYTNVRATAGEGLGELKAVLVPADQINADSINAYAESLGKGNTLLLDLKTVTGMLVWKSDTEIAKGDGTSGAVDLKPIISSLHGKKIKVAVRLCCFVDNTLASRYDQLTLRKSTGEAFSDDNGAWLDPTNSVVRDYIISLCKELDGMGVDEVVLNGMRMPEAEGVTYNFSSTTSATPTPQTAISGFAIAVTRGLQTCKANISVQVGSDRAMKSVDETTGQSAKLFFKVFDRVYRTSGTESAGSEQTAVKSMIELGEARYRYVPIVYEGTPDTSCWLKMS